MYYVIYPDTLFLENLICNLLFLTFLKSLFFPAAKGKKVFMAAAVTALCNTLASILFFRCIWILQVGALFPAAGLMICYCLEIRDKRRMFYLLYQMILWTLVIGGMLQAWEQWNDLSVVPVILSVGVLFVVFGTLEKILKIYRRQNECMREVVLYWKGRSCHVRGFADTGNQLVDPISNQPVSIITMEAWHTILRDADPPQYRLIPYKSVGNQNGLLPGVRIDYMTVSDGQNSQVIERPMIAITRQPFTGIFHYSILLHSDFY